MIRQYDTQVRESARHPEMVGRVFGVRFGGTIHFVETIKSVCTVTGFITEVWDVLRDTRMKGSSTYAEIQKGIEDGTLIRIK